MCIDRYQVVENGIKLDCPPPNWCVLCTKQFIRFTLRGMIISNWLIFFKATNQTNPAIRVPLQLKSFV